MTAGVGGAATKGTFPNGPLVCPVEAEIQQLELPVRTSHQLLSVLWPTRVMYEPCAKEPVLSYSVPGPDRQLAPTSVTKNGPAGGGSHLSRRRWRGSIGVANGWRWKGCKKGCRWLWCTGLFSCRQCCHGEGRCRIRIRCDRLARRKITSCDAQDHQEDGCDCDGKSTGFHGLDLLVVPDCIIICLILVQMNFVMFRDARRTNPIHSSSYE